MLTSIDQSTSMLNIPDVHALDREIPPGKVLVAEYGQIGEDEPRPIETVLDEKLGWGRTNVQLVARTAGWAIAGSMLRWDNGRFGVYWEMDNARHGRSHTDFADALADFNRIPTKPL